MSKQKNSPKTASKSRVSSSMSFQKLSQKIEKKYLAIGERRVITPGGYRILNSTKPKHAQMLTALELFPAVSAPSTNSGNGWVLDGEWINNTGSPVVSFSASWDVPQPPASPDDGQIIFIYNGIQSTKHLLQCVLQWGQAASGGGSYWGISCWHVTKGTSTPDISSLVQVNPGDTLTANITFQSTGTGTGDYQLAFSNDANTMLPVANMPVLSDCCIALEAYGVDNTQDYPQTDLTSISGIAITLENQPANPQWIAKNLKATLGEHMNVISSSQVDINYR